MDIRKVYRAFRSYFPSMSATRALFVARNAQPSADRVRFDFPDATEIERGSLFRGTRPACVYWRPTEYARESCVYNPRAGVGKAADWKPRGGKHVRWIESTERAGLRLVGFCDEIVNAESYRRAMDHTGWYADPFQDSLFRGIVFQLPARGGSSVFVYGYADPNNKGAALLCFDNDATDKLNAARMADSFAEWNAETEREYQITEMANNDADEARERIKECRSELREIATELASARKRCKNWRKSKRYGALFGAVKEHIGTLRDTIKEQTRLIAERMENPHSAAPY